MSLAEPPPLSHATSPMMAMCIKLHAGRSGFDLPGEYTLTRHFSIAYRLVRA